MVNLENDSEAQQELILKIIRLVRTGALTPQEVVYVVSRLVESRVVDTIEDWVPQFLAEPHVGQPPLGGANLPGHPDFLGNKPVWPV